MLLRTITLSNSGNVCLDGGGYILALGYECTRGIYQLQLRPTGEWEGLTIRACWHLPDGTSTTTLAVDGYVDVPAAVTALPGTGCITFEGAAEGKTITSSDLRYLVGDNSGVEDGSLPEPNTPAWEQLVGTVAESTAQAEEAADRADKAAAAAEGALTAVEGTVSKALTDITHAGAAQTQAVTRAGEQAVQEVDAAAQAGVGRVEQAQQTATQAVQTAATAAIQRVEQTGGTQVQAVTKAGAEQVKKIDDAAAKKLEGITQLAGQAEDSATKAEQAAQRAEDAATAASAIIDDTAITPAKTWSSLHILDALCPPIQATGNPVVCYPVAGYPLGVTVDFAPIQEGEGDPSPENVRPIKARESVDVVRCGENLLNISTVAEAVGTTVDGDKIHITDTSGWGKSFIICESKFPPGTYTIGFDASIAGFGRFIVRTYNVDGKKVDAKVTVVSNGYVAEYNKYYNAYLIYCYYTSPLHQNIQFTVSQSAYFCIGFTGGIAGSITEVDIINPTLVPGTTAPTTYAPYTGQPATLTLPAPCYGGEVDAVTGAGRETWHTIVLTGQESSHIFEKVFYLNIGNNPKPNDITSGRSSHYKYATYGKGCIGVTKDGVSAVLGAEGQFALDEAGLSAWKSYLAAQYAAGTPVQIAYKVATPTPITATGGKPIPALAGTNTLLTDGDSLTVTGRSDPSHEIQQLRAAVVALGGTI